MHLGSYCQEGTVDCLIMMISSIILLLDTIRLIFQIVQTTRQNVIRNQSSPISTINQIRGKERKLTFVFKIVGILLTIGIGIAQILIWVVINHTSQSIILLQMFSMNVVAASLWICAVVQDKKHKGYTKPSTQINMHVNLLCNIVVALLGARNSLDSHDDNAFYSYIGYITASGIYQIFIKTCQKDFQSISLDELESKDSSQFSIDQQRKTSANNKDDSTKIDTHGLTEKLLSIAGEEEENQQKEKNNAKNSNGNEVQIKSNKNNQIIESGSNNNNNSIKSKKSKDSNAECNDRSSSDKGKKSKEMNISTDNKTNNFAVQRINCDRATAIDDEEEETKICKHRIENIRIEKFSETIKYSKKTIVYEIKCTYKGKMYSVKRSFREFGSLNNTIKQKYKDKKLLDFPQKKAQNSILTYNDLEERKKQLCIYLQNVSQNCEPEELVDFITQSDSQQTSPTQQNQSGSNSPYSTQQQQQQIRNGQKKSFGDENQQQQQVTYNSGSSHNYNIPEVIWEEEELNLSTSSHE